MRAAATGDGARELEHYTSILHAQILGQLEALPRNEILLFVHGIKTSFDDALYITAELSATTIFAAIPQWHPTRC